MKKNLILSVFVLSNSFFCFGQLPAAKSFFSYRIGVNNNIGSSTTIIPSAIFSTYTNKGYTVTNEISFEWIKIINLEIGAGVGLSTSFLHLENKAGDIRKGTGLSLYPFLSLRKNVLFKCGKFAYSPNALAGVSFSHETIDNSSDPNSSIVQSNVFNSGFIKLRPISFSFIFSKTFLLGVDVGEYNIHSGSSKAEQVNNPSSQLKEKSSQTNAGLVFNIGVRAVFILK